MDFRIFGAAVKDRHRTGFRKEELQRYICIHDVDPSDMSLYATPELTEAVAWDRMIRVEKRETRLKLVAEGLGYEIGPPLPEEILEKYKLTALSTPFGDYSLILLCSKNRMSDPYVRDLVDRILACYSLLAESR